MIDFWQIVVLGLLLFLFVFLAREFRFSSRFSDREETRRVRSYFTRKMTLQNLTNEIKDRERKRKEEQSKKKKKNQSK